MIVGIILKEGNTFFFTTNNHPQSPGQKVLCFDKRKATRAGDCAKCQDHPAMSRGCLQWKCIWGGRTYPPPGASVQKPEHFYKRGKRGDNARRRKRPRGNSFVFASKTHALKSQKKADRKSTRSYCASKKYASMPPSLAGSTRLLWPTARPRS